ncbi:electron transport complex subunit E [Gynuella sunshinyii]|uniref:Ion-translocating oxidoreductase complex subunit E n=1 Tax=Gynuella sunshinyii YC6258 TaxID=1445510 RepID=A0A0C5VUI9_9GAMM|nr:electron transport complex subunit E [Gynuella sunshinyii]AJQ94069.1 putative NADH:ubiquinone oxidoreductase, subunit RnfE [Gynuella sunshinyii YC6258]
MSDHTYAQIFSDGLWRNNVALEQMLALCPLLAVTTTATNGLGMGLATIAVMIAASLLSSLLKGVITPQVRIPAFIVLIASVVTVVEMFINAWMHELYKVLGLFIPLIVTNCAILGRVEAFASKQTARASLADALAMGLGFTWVLVVVGAIRELIANGTLFHNASLLLGEHLHWLDTTVVDNYQGALLMALPPGGFIMLGFLLSIKRLIDQHRRKPATNTTLTQLQEA